MEAAHIAANKNTVPGDVSAMVPGGIRMGKTCIHLLFSCGSLARYFYSDQGPVFDSSGTPALTSRGFMEDDFAKVAEYFDVAVKIALKIKAATKGVFCNNIVDVKYIIVSKSHADFLHECDCRY